MNPDEVMKVWDVTLKVASPTGFKLGEKVVKVQAYREEEAKELALKAARNGNRRLFVAVKAIERVSGVTEDEV